MRAAVVGCGPRGREHADALRQAAGLELVAVADADERAREAGATLGVPVRDGLDRLLAEDAPELLVLATPPRVRLDLVEPAVASGGVRALVVEKPLALTLDEAEATVAACERAGVTLALCHQLRFCPGFEELHASIEAGDLGELRLVQAVGFGNLLEQGPHLIDAARWLAGGAPATWAMSQRGDAAIAGLPREALPPSGEPHPAPPWTSHQLAFDNGIRAVVETGALYQRGSGFFDDWLAKRVAVVGTHGSGEAHAAAGWRIVTADGVREGPGGPDTYAAATIRLHEDVRDAVVEGRPPRTDGRDALVSLEALVACAQSAVDGDAAVLPLSRERDPVAELAGAPARERVVVPTEPEHADEPAFSVLLPIPDHRGHMLDAVRSWLTQTLPREQFELIVASDGAEPGLERQVEELLGDDDRIVRADGAHETVLYDTAARAARGRFLFLTEPHCEAEPDCLEEMLSYLERTRYEGACVRSLALGGNALARMEQLLYDEGFEEWSRPGHWCKVILRGLALRRETYLAVGGFETRYDRFAEFELAMALNRRGARLGYAGAAAVRHAYTNSWADLMPPIRDFSRGEIAYRGEHPGPETEQYVGPPPEWATRTTLDPGAARAACSVAFRNLFRRSVWRSPAGVRGMLRTLRRLAPTAVAGPRANVLAARLSYRSAVIRCSLWRAFPRRLEPAYRQAYARLIAWSQIEWLAEHGAEAPTLPEGSHLPIESIPDDCLFGFNPTERANGHTYRWTRAVAHVDLPEEPRPRGVRLETLPLRPGEAPLCQWAFLDGRRLPASAVSLEERAVKIELPRPGRRLTLSVAPLEPWREGSADRRELGVPVTAVDLVA